MPQISLPRPADLHGLQSIIDHLCKSGQGQRCPGNVATRMLHNQHVLDMYAGGPGGSIDETRFPAEATNLLPVPWFEPEAVAQAAVFLASEDGRYITGTDFAIDAGATNQPPGIPGVAATRLGELQYEVAHRS